MRSPYENSDASTAASHEQWARHEHVADPAQIAAQRLVDATGSVELAKQVLNNATEPTNDSAGSSAESRDLFARGQGFGSYLEMFEAAEPISDPSHGVWMIASIGSTCIAWSEREFVAITFANRDEAATAIARGSLGSGGRPVD